jgi:hypothetical protein
VIMTEQEIIEFAKTNDYCWAGLQRRHPEVADWMELHWDHTRLLMADETILCKPTSNGWPGNVYRLRPDYEPEPEMRWTRRPSVEAENIQKARSCIGLLNSMIRSGESHSDTSCRMLVEALDALDYLEQHNASLTLAGKEG